MEASRKAGQRERILRAMTDLVAREGYARSSIAQTIALARVSRSTFYEHFEDKLDCFLTLERELGASALAKVEQAVRNHPAEKVTDKVLSTLVELAEKDPAGTRLLLSESLAAGVLAMDERDRFVGRVEQLVEDAWTPLSPSQPALDIPARVLVGGTCRLLSIRITRGASGMYGLLPDLLSWTNSYARPTCKPRWRTLRPRDGTPLPRSPHAAVPRPAPPARLPPGRHGLPASYVSSNQRERILHATTAAVLRRGYASTRVADIVAEAHLTRAVFYQHFRDKQDVLTELNQIHFQQMMAVSSSAFFSAGGWPARVWAGIHATGDLIVDNPAFARLGFLESNAVGPESVRRTYDLMMAFAVFLEEGYRQRPQAESLPRLCSDAITAALCELLYWETRRGRAGQFRELIPHVAYIALAPFMGPEDADEFVEGELRSSGSRAELEQRLDAA